MYSYRDVIQEVLERLTAPHRKSVMEHLMKYLKELVLEKKKDLDKITEKILVSTELYQKEVIIYNSSSLANRLFLGPAMACLQFQQWKTIRKLRSIKREFAKDLAEVEVLIKETNTYLTE